MSSAAALTFQQVILKLQEYWGEQGCALLQPYDMATLITIHEKMYKALAHAGGRIDGIFYCPHTADSACECRKPKPGMAMSSNYNSRPRAAEVIVDGDTAHLVRSRERIDDLFASESLLP